MEALAAYFQVPIGHILNGDEIAADDPREALVSAYAHLSAERRRQAEQFVQFLLQEQRAASAGEPSQD
ncbi:hypothetical protein [Paracoccus sp. 22332]|uniref:hypothetical protein n=1 Tax=Paracoccus sp. 22332 TaxID=3453913 RepID=UPI003F871F54